MNSTYHFSSYPSITFAPKPSSLSWTRSPIFIDVAATLAIQIVFFWGSCAVYMSLPYLFPKFSQRHKIQGEDRQPTREELRECFRNVMGNQIISTVLHLVADILSVRAGRPLGLNWDLPSISEIVIQIAVGMVLRDTLLYYAHRVLHHPYLYKHLHKVHHQFTAPVALASQYAHPVEHIIMGMVPVVLPMAILGAHAVTYWIWVSILLLETTTLHSGYDFLERAVTIHEDHHIRFTVNYGSIGLMDWIMGTRGVDRPRLGKGRAKKE